MISKKRLREKFRSYHKAFKQNWDLFKASKIGIVGIIIVLFFVAMAVITPFLNLRDPINWRAPDADIIDVTSYWGQVGINTSEPSFYHAGNPINHSVTYRVKQREGQQLQADRVYFTSGNKLFAVRPSEGDSYWRDEVNFTIKYGFNHNTSAGFSTEVAVANFGYQFDSTLVDYILGVGTYDGYIYLIEDYEGEDDFDAREPIPSGDMVYQEKLDSGITSVALYSDENDGRRPVEKFFFGTENGYLYAYSVTKLDNENWVYDSISGSWTSVSMNEGEIRPTPRKDFSMAYDSSNERIVLFGGYDGSLNDETWVFDPASLTWTKIDTADHPSERRGHAMTYDPDSGKIVLFGGITDTSPLEYSNETWTFNVSSMTWVDETENIYFTPSHRAECAMTYDRLNGLVVLFGGSDGGDETWTYDVNARNWSMEPTFGPSWRSEHAMTYDSENRLVVLFGGNDGGRETWTYNVTSDVWNMTTNTSGPSERFGHAMVYDNTSKVVVLFGGSDGGDETWTYDVATNVWTQLFPSVSSPSAREGHAMVYDSDRKVIHLYGGDDQQFSRLWYRELSPGIPIIMAGFPLNTPQSPYYSPALTDDGTRIFVNDGELHGLYTVNGTDAWEKTYSIGANWMNPPVVALPAEIGGVYEVEVVYATSSDGWIYARYASNGSALPDWLALEYINPGVDTDGGIPVKKSALEFDGGVLTVPDIYDKDIFVGSSTGYLYKIRRDTTYDLPAGSSAFVYKDEAFIKRGFRFTGGVRYIRENTLLFAVGYEDSGTPEDPNDDVGTLFVIGIDGYLSWRKSFDGRIGGTPSVWKDEAGSHPTRSIWFATDGGVVQSYSSTGQNKAPLEPGCYASGNCYVLGTDSQGRDIFSQLMWGSQIALTVGLLAAAGSIGIGVIIGLVAGYSGGKIDTVLMRFTDVILVLPGLPFIIILAAVLGPSYWNIIFVLTIIGWPGTARVIRSEVLSLKERPFIDSAKVTGASNIRIMFKHLVPNVLPLAFLFMTFAVSGAILSEAALSFLGLGDVNTASWGQMLNAIQAGNVLGAWWWLVPPGLGITFISLSFYLIGRAFEQIVNPRLRRR